MDVLQESPELESVHDESVVIASSCTCGSSEIVLTKLGIKGIDLAKQRDVPQHAEVDLKRKMKVISKYLQHVRENKKLATVTCKLSSSRFSSGKFNRICSKSKEKLGATDWTADTLISDVIDASSVQKIVLTKTKVQIKLSLFR